MRLYIYCKHCNKEIKVKGNFATRWELSATRGKEFELNCLNCNQKSTYIVDDVKARSGVLGTVALLLLFPCIAVILWLLYPYSTKGIIPMFLLTIGVLIPALIYAAILREEKRKIESFNSTCPNSLKSIKFKKKF